MAIDSFESARYAVTGGTAPDAAARELVSHMTPEERLWCLDGDAPTLAGAEFLTTADGYHRAPFLAAQVPRVGVPGIAFSDGPRGAVIGDATCFPVTMARGATWDPDLEERVGDAIGRELRATGANLTGAVCVNLLRHPAWGRAQETYGEDPHHVGEMGAAFTRGLQRHVMACVKHFACNSMENARFTVDIEVDDIALHEIYLAHFKRIVDEGVASVMSAYNSVNGAWCGENRQLLTDILRGEWGFEGFVISDFVFGVHDGAASVRAGLDIEMPFRMARAQYLPRALERGEVTWAEVDRAVERIVATLLRFDTILSGPVPGEDTLGRAAHRLLAREVAARSVVLLRNELVEGRPVLPLSLVDSPRLAVFGPLADTVNLGDHGSSDVWDLDCHTVLEALRSISSGVVYDEGSDSASAAVVAGDADVALVVVGYTSLDEGEFMGEMTEAMLANFPLAGSCAEHFDSEDGDGRGRSGRRRGSRGENPTPHSGLLSFGRHHGGNGDRRELSELQGRSDRRARDQRAGGAAQRGARERAELALFDRWRAESDRPIDDPVRGCSEGRGLAEQRARDGPRPRRDPGSQVAGHQCAIR